MDEIKLRITYCIPDIDSGENWFSEIIGGRHDTTPEQAVTAVITAARAWVRGMREEFPSISAWDDAGNHY